MTNPLFSEKLSAAAKEVEDILEKYNPVCEGYQKDVIEAMNYSVMAGGKRLRPVLMKQTFILFGGNDKIIEPFMAAIEMIHNYSLVHDDLPAMDNDEYRRGRKTTWTVYGDGMAVLAGDGLLNYAFETALGAFDMVSDKEGYEKVSAALTVLAKKAGIYGMIGGQSADIMAENKKDEVTPELLLFIHKHKTAALIEASMMIGAILAGAGKEDVAKIEKAAYDIGVAFQIKDDILDVTGTEEVLGKPIGSDEKNNKKTYVTLVGLEKSEEEVLRYSTEAVEIIKGFDNRNEFLEELVQSLITRNM